MRRTILFIIPILFSMGLFIGFVIFLSKTNEKGALQVTSLPKSKVVLNGKEIGQTPLCKCDAAEMLPIGEYTIQLIPQEGSYTPFAGKVKIIKSVLTVVDRSFGLGVTSEGSSITLSPVDDKKKAELLILSFPDGANVFIDSSEKGKTPLLLKDVTESDHEIKLQKSGYKEKIIRIRAILGYRLEAMVYLGVDDMLQPSATPTASPSAVLLPSLSPVPSTVGKVIILETPTGFLRVRETGSVTAIEIGRVLPNENYDLVEEKTGWYAIKLKTGKVGWISSQYAEKEISPTPIPTRLPTSR